MIESKKYDEGSAFYVLARFCEAIKKKDWKTAVEFCTHAYKKTARPIDHLKEFHGGHKVTDISLMSVSYLSEVAYQAHIAINATKENGEFAYVIELLLIKQDRKRCLAHEAGDWGVNPDSFKILSVSKDKLKKEEAKKTTIKKRRTKKK